MGLVQQGLTPGHLSSPPVSGFRSYPLRGSHSLDDLLDRPGNSTASSEYWDGQSRSRTPSRVPSHAPSPAPTPLPGSRRGSMGSTGVPSDVKVSPSPKPALNSGVVNGQGDQRPGNPLCFATVSGSGPSHPGLSLPSPAGKGGGSTRLRHWTPRCPAGSWKRPVLPASPGEARPRSWVRAWLGQPGRTGETSPMGSRLGLVPSPGDGTLAQRLLKSETHRILGFRTPGLHFPET